MRTALTVVALWIVVVSVVMDVAAPYPNSIFCRAGFCRFDQLYEGIDAQGSGPQALAALVNQDSSNPLVWSSYGEVLARHGQEAAAADAFERAVALAPGMPAIQMRAANYFMTRENPHRARALFRRALAQTAAFDGIIFSYFPPSRITVEDWLDTAIPPSPRAARSWLAWLRSNGSEQDARRSWSWAHARGLVDQTTAADLAFGMWRRHMYGAAHEIWLDVKKPRPGDEMVVNAEFADAPCGGPFEWTLSGPPSVTILRQNGLEIRFSGTENVGFWDVRQGTIVDRPGTYRFAAEIESENLTTDQGPYFHVVDPARAEIVHAETRQIRGTTPRSWIMTDIFVPSNTEALEVILERQRSLQILNQISGTLRIFRVSLLPSHSLKEHRD